MQILFLFAGRFFAFTFPWTLCTGLPALAVMEKVASFALGHVLVLAVGFIVVVSTTMAAMLFGKRA